MLNNTPEAMEGIFRGASGFNLLAGGNESRLLALISLSVSSYKTFQLKKLNTYIGWKIKSENTDGIEITHIIEETTVTCTVQFYFIPAVPA